jgi:lysyl-tRNA synthetase class 2
VLAELQARDRMLGAIRGWFRSQDFLEVETPVLFRAPGLNPHIAEFETAFRAGKRDERLWLRTSPEVFHKRLLASGVPRLYEIGRFFRNGESTERHNPEFTGLEFYEAGFDYARIMERTEGVLAHAIEAVVGKPLAGGIDVTPPWERITVAEAFARHAGVTLQHETEALRSEAERIGIRTTPDDRYDDVFFRIYVDKVEPNLGKEKPVFLHDYPVSMGVMARRKPSAPEIAERVELYIGGVELANGFSELTDPDEQRARFEADRRLVAERDDVAPASLPLDEGFLAALAKMPSAAGIAIGLDRVLMLALGKRSIREVIAFPFD